MDFAGENNPNFRHGLTNGKSYRHPIYQCWQNMKARCFNPNYQKFHRYGGRGISVCKEWLDCAAFARWAILNGWAEGLTIDRIDNDKNYEPSNCRWIGKGMNSRKKSTTKLTITQASQIRSRAYNGESEYDLAAEFGVVHGTIWFIVHNMTHDESLQ